MEGQTSHSLSHSLTNMLQDVKPPEMCEFSMQCIYRVPETLRETNPKAYTPRIVSIGPFHKERDAGKEDSIFESMEELKVNYLKAFLNRSQVPVGTFVDTLQALENDIRSCYAVRIKYNSDDFLKMILIDACFIIEFFFRFNAYRDWHTKDPLILKEWMLMQIGYDLILLENQIPFFVLEELYNLAGMNLESSFLWISFRYLKNFAGLGYVARYLTKSPKHFTDLLRTCLISSSTSYDHLPREEEEHIGIINHVYSASQLWEAGLKFKAVSPDNDGNFLDLIRFKEGVLTMPILYMHDCTEILFRNIVAFEHCHLPYNQNIITQYLVLLDFLINTEKDVNILVDKKIIANLMDDANAVATTVNRLSSKLLMPFLNYQYYSLCKSLNDFHENPCNKYKAVFKHEYFNTPWKILSIVAAIVLLLLTLTQTIFSII